MGVEFPGSESRKGERRGRSNRAAGEIKIVWAFKQRGKKGKKEAAGLGKRERKKCGRRLIPLTVVLRIEGPSCLPKLDFSAKVELRYNLAFFSPLHEK